MLRTALAVLTLALAAPAFAAGPTDVKEAKAEMKAAKKYNKSVDKAISKRRKVYEKGKYDKMAKVDADLEEIVADELRRLRQAGIPTQEEPERQLPEPTRFVDGQTVLLADLAQSDPQYRRIYNELMASRNPPPEHPVKEAYRDDLVQIRDITRAAARGKAKPSELKQKSRLLTQIDRKAENRYERADARYRRARS